MDAQASPWSPNGVRVVVTVIVHSTLLEAERRHRGGRNVAHIEGLSSTVERIYYVAVIGRPLCIHSATTAMPLRHLCLIRATVERPTSSVTLLRLFWTRSKFDGSHGVHGDCWTSCVPPFNDQGIHAASFGRPMATWSVLWSGRTREAQRSWALCKGGITEWGPMS